MVLVWASALILLFVIKNYNFKYVKALIGTTALNMLVNISDQVPHIGIKYHTIILILKKSTVSKFGIKSQFALAQEQSFFSIGIISPQH